jgi:two-component system, OmpR family, sensor kinase
MVPSYELSPSSVRGCVARLAPDGTVAEILLDPTRRCAEVVGGSFLDLLDEGSRAKGLLLLERLREHGHAVGWELRLGNREATLLRFSGVREGDHLLAVGTPFDEDPVALLGAVADVDDAVVAQLRELAGGPRVGTTVPFGGARSPYDALNRELIDLHRELARRTAQLEEVNEQKNQLIGMAAHDLRNPIGAIRGFAQLLLSRIADRLDDRERMVLERIERSSEHMLELVNDLLELTEVDRAGLAVQLDRVPCDVAALVQRSVEVDRALAEQKGITIQLELETTPLVAVVDGGKFEQVLANLLSNAVKFSPSGATVVVLLRAEEQIVVLEVRDEGPGIPEAERERVFEPFARTSVRPTAGERSTGLGLAIVERIVAGHGGRIELDTEPGAGSTFRVLLPCTPDDEVPAAEPPVQAPAPGPPDSGAAGSGAAGPGAAGSGAAGSRAAGSRAAGSTPARSQPTTSRTSS